MPEPTANITALLRQVADGDRRNLDALMTAIYADLRRLAESQLRTERANHTLQPTALVHEAYLKLIDQRKTDWQDRAHFFAVASRVIRRILVDYARLKQAVKRGQGQPALSLDSIDVAIAESTLDFVALDQALNELASIDSRQAEIVELRFFGGMTLDEVAEALKVPARTVDRFWASARAWLFVRLAETQDDG